MNLLAILLSIVPYDAHIVRDGADMVEYSRVYNDAGELYLEQFIAWDWRGGRHEVAGWRLMAGKAWRPPLVVWSEGDKTFVLRAKYWRETWEQYDPEMEQRDYLSKCHRRGLFGEKP